MTIHYRWHPQFGRSLPVARCAPRASQPLIYCEFPDGTIAGVPPWMADAAVCSLHALGPPEARVGALIELRRLLDAWRDGPCAAVSGGPMDGRPVGPRLRRGDRR